MIASFLLGLLMILVGYTWTYHSEYAGKGDECFSCISLTNSIAGGLSESPLNFSANSMTINAFEQILGTGSNPPGIQISFTLSKGGGSIYITDPTRQQIVKLDANGVKLMTIQFEKDEIPRGLAVSSSLDIYVIIERPDVIPSGFYRDYIKMFSQSGELIVSRPINRPFDIDTDSKGNVYVVGGDLTSAFIKYNHNLSRIIDSFGVSRGSTFSPTKIAISSDDLIYLVDNKKVIRTFDTSLESIEDPIELDRKIAAITAVSSESIYVAMNNPVEIILIGQSSQRVIFPEISNVIIQIVDMIVINYVLGDLIILDDRDNDSLGDTLISTCVINQ